MSVIRYLALVPRDGIFCKDGRGWYTSASGRGYGLDWPWPSTLLGALRTACGRDQEHRIGSPFDADQWREHAAAVRLGKSLALRRPHDAAWTSEHRVWPVPADALWLEGGNEVYRLDPIPREVATLGRDDDDTREALWWPRLELAGKPLPAPRWWSETDFSAWLAGTAVPVRAREDSLAPARRVQVHVKIRNDELTAEEGILFSHDVLETLEAQAEWAVGVEVQVPEGGTPSVATLGSDSRLAKIEELPSSLFEPPQAVLGAFPGGCRGLRLVTVTPTCFQRGWLPDGFQVRDAEYRGQLQGVSSEVVLRAAFVPRPVHVSGWDMAANNGRGAPKPTSRMVPPGAVYFFECADGQSFQETDARELWLAALGGRREEGFGRVVPGVWNPRRQGR